MAAVRAILSTLNGLAQGMPTGGRARARRRVAATTDVHVVADGPWEGPYAHAGPEPLLEELLADPLIRLVMRADRVEPAELRGLLGLDRPPLAV